MRSRLLLAAAFVPGVIPSLFSSVLASHPPPRELGAAKAQPCGMQCFLDKLPESKCAEQDRDCQCKDSNLQDSISQCILEHCSMADTLSTSKIIASACNLPVESRAQSVVVIASSMYAIALACVALRVVGRTLAQRISYDDYAAIFAVLLVSMPYGVVVKMTKLGFGKHLWNLEEGRVLPIMRFFAIAWSTYILILGIIKVSLVLCYLEIFHTPRFRKACWIVLGLIIVNSLTLYLLTVFACTPIAYFWNRDIGGKCMNIQALAMANSVSAIVQDITLLIMPLIAIRNLNMELPRKLAVGLMFCVGTLGCIATIIRFRSLLAFKFAIDPTWDYVTATNWTCVELCACFVCISLPAIRLLLLRLVPQRTTQYFYSTVFGTTEKAPDPLELPGESRVDSIAITNEVLVREGSSRSDYPMIGKTESTRVRSEQV